MGGIGLRTSVRFPLSLALKGSNPASYDNEDGEDERTISVIFHLMTEAPSVFRVQSIFDAIDEIAAH